MGAYEWLVVRCFQLTVKHPKWSHTSCNSMHHGGCRACGVLPELPAAPSPLGTTWHHVGWDGKGGWSGRCVALWNHTIPKCRCRCKHVCSPRCPLPLNEGVDVPRLKVCSSCTSHYHDAAWLSKHMHPPPCTQKHPPGLIVHSCNLPGLPECLHEL